MVRSIAIAYPQDSALMKKNLSDFIRRMTA